MFSSKCLSPAALSGIPQGQHNRNQRKSVASHDQPHDHSPSVTSPVPVLTATHAGKLKTLVTSLCGHIVHCADTSSFLSC